MRTCIQTWSLYTKTFSNYFVPFYPHFWVLEKGRGKGGAIFSGCVNSLFLHWIIFYAFDITNKMMSEIRKVIIWSTSTWLHWIFLNKISHTRSPKNWMVGNTRTMLMHSLYTCMCMYILTCLFMYLLYGITKYSFPVNDQIFSNFYRYVGWDH